jgi:hypothetical protein
MRRDQEPAALAHGVDDKGGNTAAALETPASNRGSLVAFLATRCKGKYLGEVGKERGCCSVIGGAERVGGVGEVVRLGCGEVGGG